MDGIVGKLVVELTGMLLGNGGSWLMSVLFGADPSLWVKETWSAPRKIVSSDEGERRLRWVVHWDGALGGKFNGEDPDEPFAQYEPCALREAACAEVLLLLLLLPGDTGLKLSDRIVFGGVGKFPMLPRLPGPDIGKLKAGGNFEAVGGGGSSNVGRFDVADRLAEKLDGGASGSCPTCM